MADADGPYAATEDTTLVVTQANGVLNGDTDPEGGALAAEVVTPTANGALTLNADGSFSCTPNANFNGTDSFVYRARDVGGLASGDVTVQINVAAVNDPATIAGTATGSVTEDGTLTAGGQLAVVDPDSGEAAFRVPVSLAGTYGSFTFDAATGLWGYTLDNASAVVQALTAADVRTETLLVTSLDGTASETITVTVQGADETISNGNGSGTIGGTTGSDVFTPGGGNDTVNGGAGNDVVIAAPGDGNDVYNGGPGIDTVDYSAVTSNLRIDLNGNARSTDTGRDRLSSIENIVGGSGDDRVDGNGQANTVDGGAGNDRINGLGGNDSLRGGDGNDVLDGGTGNDVLDGGAGNDRIAGSSGADRLVGGTGNDTLIGDGGADRFVFGPGFGNDRIEDFDANPTGGQDLIELEGFGITAENFAARVAITDVGRDTLVTIDSDAGLTILLSGIRDATTVTVDDFRFS